MNSIYRFLLLFFISFLMTNQNVNAATSRTLSPKETAKILENVDPDSVPGLIQGASGTKKDLPYRKTLIRRDENANKAINTFLKSEKPTSKSQWQLVDTFGNRYQGTFTKSKDGVTTFNYKDPYGKSGSVDVTKVIDLNKQNISTNKQIVKQDKYSLQVVDELKKGGK